MTGTSPIDKGDPSKVTEDPGDPRKNHKVTGERGSHRHQQQQGCVIVSPTTKNRQGRGPRAQSARALSSTDPREVPEWVRDPREECKGAGGSQAHRHGLRNVASGIVDPKPRFERTGSQWTSPTELDPAHLERREPSVVDPVSTLEGDLEGSVGLEYGEVVVSTEYHRRRRSLRRSKSQPSQPSRGLSRLIPVGSQSVL